MIPVRHARRAHNWIVRVSGVYLLSRVVSFVVFLGMSALQGPSSYTAAHPDYLTFANFWDARWYAFIASAGYPGALPLDGLGHVIQNSWAFLPVYPFVVRGVAAILGSGWPLAAVVVSLLAGWGFVLVSYTLFRDRLSEAQSTWAVAFIAFAPVSPLFGTGYAESLFLFLLAVSLLLLTRRHYGTLAAFVALLAFTRPGALAFALTIAVHWWSRRRSASRREHGILAALIAWTVILGLAWPLIAAAVTGRFDAYFQTELAWRAAYIGRGELVPGTGWFLAANWWFGQPLGIIVPIAVALALVLLLAIPAARRLSVELRGWVASYSVYLFLVFFPQSSSFRILAPLFPLAGVLGQIRSAWLKLGLCVLGVFGQVLWLYWCWVVIGQDWTPP